MKIFKKLRGDFGATAAAIGGVLGAGAAFVPLIDSGIKLTDTSLGIGKALIKFGDTRQQIKYNKYEHKREDGKKTKHFDIIFTNNGPEEKGAAAFLFDNGTYVVTKSGKIGVPNTIEDRLKGKMIVVSAISEKTRQKVDCPPVLLKSNLEFSLVWFNDIPICTVTEPAEYKVV